MRRVGTATLAAVAVLSAQLAGAAPLDWMTAEQKSAIAQIGSAYAWSHLCNRSIDHAVARDFLAAKLGLDRRYDAREAADLMFTVVGSLGMQQALAGSNVRQGCAEAAKAFGPAGTTIRGFLK